ncbi:MAG: FtsH protease activity modulator HflK [Lachnospiraceae bacterium]|nr:FtsH protease activity modulator HflK [Lachnospiraceae bacterium]
MPFDWNSLFGKKKNRAEKNKNTPSPKSIRTVIIGVVLALVLLSTLSGCYFHVNEQEQAVVTMFGQVQGVRSAGLYFKIPFLQQAHLVDTTTHGMPIGYTVSSSGERDGQNAVSTHEASMITSDFNFVDIDFYLEYRVSDPVAYLYASNAPEDILRNVAQATIRATVVNYTVDDVITTAKSRIQAEVRETITRELEELQIGLQIVNISIQDAEPPTDEIIEAFKAVETAKQGAETAVNNARQYQSEKLPAAEAEADRILQQAEAEKAGRIAEAQGQVARFTQMYEEYAKNPGITRQRLYYEIIEEVLPGLRIIISDGGTQTLLPLADFTGGQEQ